MGIIRFFRGYLELRVTGASPERFLNVLAENNIKFWNLDREDELHYRLCIYAKREKAAEKAAVKSFCTMEIVKVRGIRNYLKKAGKRPALCIGVPLALIFGIFMQNLVLAVDVEGTKTLHDEEIVHALEEIGIGIGSPGWKIEQQETKNQMLNLLPELSWIGVNRSGCRLHVLVTERSFGKSSRPACPAGNLVAVRDGVLTDVIVSEGMKLCSPGDTVKKGQVLVSGFEDYGLILKGVCAEGEIYGQTWHTGTVVTPTTLMKKAYTGRVWNRYSLVIGRKRINLFGNSGISGATCDKMLRAYVLSVPDFCFPVKLEKQTFREYELREIPLSAETARMLLQSAWESQTADSMIAGKIQSTETSFRESGGLYVLRADSVCSEMLARFFPMDRVYEGETDE